MKVGAIAKFEIQIIIIIPLGSKITLNSWNSHLPVGRITIGLLEDLYVLNNRTELFDGHGHSEWINYTALSSSYQASLTADTLSLCSIALTDTSYITGTVHDTILASYLTIMNTSHVWVSSNYFIAWTVAIIISDSSGAEKQFRNVEPQVGTRPEVGTGTEKTVPRSDSCWNWKWKTVLFPTVTIFRNCKENLRAAIWIKQYFRCILYRFWPNKIGEKGAQFLQNHFI